MPHNASNELGWKGKAVRGCGKAVPPEPRHRTVLQRPSDLRHCTLLKRARLESLTARGRGGQPLGHQQSVGGRRHAATTHLTLVIVRAFVIPAAMLRASAFVMVHGGILQVIPGLHCVRDACKCGLTSSMGRARGRKRLRRVPLRRGVYALYGVDRALGSGHDEEEIHMAACENLVSSRLAEATSSLETPPEQLEPPPLLTHAEICELPAHLIACEAQGGHHEASRFGCFHSSQDVFEPVLKVRVHVAETPP